MRIIIKTIGNKISNLTTISLVIRVLSWGSVLGDRLVTGNLHAIRARQRKCQWPLKNVGNSYLSRFRTMHGELTSMMTSSNGNIFRVTGHLCGEFTGPRINSQWLVTRSVDVFFHLRPNKRLSNGETGDLRRYRDHCDDIVMEFSELVEFVLYNSRTPFTDIKEFVLYNSLAPGKATINNWLLMRLCGILLAHYPTNKISIFEKCFSQIMTSVYNFAHVTTAGLSRCGVYLMVTRFDH